MKLLHLRPSCQQLSRYYMYIYDTCRLVWVLTQARQQGYAPSHYPGTLRWPNYLPHNMHLPTTVAAAQHRLL